MPANALTLPAEVICEIFLHLGPGADDPDLDEDACAVLAWHVGWLPASQICQKWRHAALGFAELWAESLCAFASDKLTDCFFERAQSMPLVFTTERGRLTEHQIILALSRKRAARLHVFKPGRVLPVSFTRALRKSTLSHLHTLRLKRWQGAGDNLMTRLRLKTPVLRELYLDSVFFAVDAPLLRVLSVTNNAKAHRGKFRDESTTLAVLAALNNSPLLEQLTLEGTHAFDLLGGSDTLKNWQTTLRLPELHRVRLQDEHNDFGMFDLVQAARTADVNLAIGDCDPADDLPYLFTAMESHMNAPGYDTLIVYEEQDDDGGTHVNIRLRSSHSRRERDAETGEPEFALDVCIAPDRTLGAPGIIALLAEHIYAPDIRFLDLGEIGTEYVEVTPAEVRQAFELFKGVTTVRLHARHLTSLRALCADDFREEPSWV